MSTQAGRDMLIKIDMTGDGQFETIAGLRTTRFALARGLVDATAMDSPEGWRELLGESGLCHAEVKGAGVFRDASADARLREVFFAGNTPNFALVIPDFGTLFGRFQISALNYLGAFDGEARFEIALASAGLLQFVPDGASGPEPVLDSAEEVSGDESLIGAGEFLPTEDSQIITTPEGDEVAVPEEGQSIAPISDGTELSEMIIEYDEEAAP